MLHHPRRAGVTRPSLPASWPACLPALLTHPAGARPPALCFSSLSLPLTLNPAPFALTPALRSSRWYTQNDCKAARNTKYTAAKGSHAEHQAVCARRAKGVQDGGGGGGGGRGRCEDFGAKTTGRGPNQKQAVVEGSFWTGILGQGGRNTIFARSMPGPDGPFYGRAQSFNLLVQFASSSGNGMVHQAGQDAAPV